MVNVVDISYQNRVWRSKKNQNDMFEIVCEEENWNVNWDHKMHEEDRYHRDNRIDQVKSRLVMILTSCHHPQTVAKDDAWYENNEVY